MDRNRQKDFARRISQANKTELVVITYDIIIEEIDCGVKALAQGSREEGRAALKSAQKFLGELMSVLDYKFAISKRLLNLSKTRCRAWTAGLKARRMSSSDSGRHLPR